MNEKQALEIIKAVLDQATLKGVFQNIDSSAAAIQAFKIIADKLNKDAETGDN